MDLDTVIAFNIHDIINYKGSFSSNDLAAHAAIFFPDETTAALRARCARIASEMFADGEMTGYRRCATYMDNNEVIHYSPAIRHDFSLKEKKSLLRRLFDRLFGGV